jgi:ribose transport system ATP-binding protein
MRGGRIVRELVSADTSEEDVMFHATGTAGDQVAQGHGGTQ